MSNINVNITYVVTGWEEISEESIVLYAGCDEEQADKASENSFMRDFEKEVWSFGKSVKVYKKTSPDSIWSVHYDGTRKKVEEAEGLAKLLMQHIDLLEAVKYVVSTEEDKEKWNENIREMSNSMNTIKHIIEELYV